MGVSDRIDELAGRALRTRWFVRAPIKLYRARLGFLLGHRMLMLEHTGRTSGLSRQVVLEVVERPAADTYVIVSGFGERAQWYRNILAEPAVHVSVGARRHVPARATPMTAAESAAVLARYATERPQTWKRLKGSIEAAVGAPVDTLPMVTLKLDPGGK